MMTDTKSFPQEFVHLEQHLNRTESHRTKGNVSALQGYVTKTPALSEKSQVLSEEIEEKLLFYIASGDVQKKAKLKVEIENLREQLIGTDTCHIAEYLLAHEISLSLLLMRYYDAKLTRHYDHMSSLETRKMDAIHSRLMRSLKTYAAVKKAIPDFAINLTQVNMG